MIIIEPVIESYDAKGFGAWPVGTDLGSQCLVLSGELTSADVGTVMAVVAVYNRTRIASSGEDDEHPSAAGLIQSPSCCCGLEDWREWNHVSPGNSPWLGHSPTPWVERLGRKIRVWPDGGDEAAPLAGASPIEIPASDLPRLIEGAHTQLKDFLDLLEPWAIPLAGATASDLGPALAAQFRVNWPAPAPERAPETQSRVS